MRGRGSRSATAAGVAVILGVSAARADADSVARADALFREGRRLFDAGDVTHACPKLAESQRLDPQNGTLLNLAICHEKEGKVASAWSEFTELAPKARAANQGERAAFAQKHAGDLEPALPRLVLRLAPETQAELFVDGKKVAATGTPLPYDPGPVHVEARAPGQPSWTKDVVLARGATTEVVVPSLERGAPAPETAVTPSGPPSGVRESSGPPRPPASSPLRTVGLVGVGVGAAGIVFGAVTWGLALSKKSDLDADAGCPERCADTGAVDGYNTLRTLSGIGFIAGAAIAIAGGVLFIVAPKQSRVRADASGATFRF